MTSSTQNSTQHDLYFTCLIQVPLLLLFQVRLGFRYSHVFRLRTDTLWFHAWGNLTYLRQLLPPLSHTVAAPGLLPRPPHLLTPTFLSDAFWIASRAAANSVFVGFANHLERPIDRKHLYHYFNCPWPPPLPPPQSTRNASAPKRAGAAPAAGEDKCFEQIMGPFSVWPEIRLHYFLTRRFAVVDSCLYTGPLLSVHGSQPGGTTSIADICHYPALMRPAQYAALFLLRLRVYLGQQQLELAQEAARDVHAMMLDERLVVQEV